MKLFIDDKRTVDMSHNSEKGLGITDFVIVRDDVSCLDFIDKNFESIDLVSFDHDLGGELKGLVVANWIEEKAYNKEIQRIEWRVHSQNTRGNEDIVRAMESADRFWEDTNKDATSNDEIKLSQDYQIYSIQDAIQNREDIVPSLLRNPKQIKKKKKIKMAENINEPKRTIKITQADYDKVQLLVKKIFTGNKNWSPEELQLQANHPEVIEILLRRNKNELV